MIRGRLLHLHRRTSHCLPMLCPSRHFQSLQKPSELSTRFLTTRTLYRLSNVKMMTSPTLAIPRALSSLPVPPSLQACATLSLRTGEDITPTEAEYVAMYCIPFRSNNTDTNSAYALPNDDVENEREDMKHATVLAVCGEKLHFAPLNSSPHDQTRVLDIGTGTGIWCLDMADKYPLCDVLGVDLSPHQPEWVPPNCRFVVDDYESEWLYPENHFDMVHARHTALGVKNWDHVLSSAMTALKPGGWLEFCEFSYLPCCDDGTMPPDHQHLYWTHLVAEGLLRFNVRLHSALTLRSRIEQAGYSNVTEHVLKVPIGQWPKNEFLRKIGAYMHAVLYDGLQGIAMGPLTRGLGWRAEDVELLLPGVRKAIGDPNIHTYYNLHVIYGQKV